MARQLYTTSTVLELLEDDELLPVEDMYEGSDEEFDMDEENDDELENEMEQPEETYDTSFEQGLEGELDHDEGDGIASTTANSDDVVTVTKVDKKGKKLAKSSIICSYCLLTLSTGKR